MENIFRTFWKCITTRSLIRNSTYHIYIFSKAFLDDIAISLCRLTETAEPNKKSGTPKNNTLYQLLQTPNLDISEIDEVKKLIEPIRNLRNKILAHSDFDVTLKNHIDNTADGHTTIKLNFPLQLNDLENIINKINCIINKATNQNVLYKNIQTPFGEDGGVQTFIDTIKTALFYSYLEKDRKMDSFDFYQEWQEFRFKDA